VSEIRNNKSPHQFSPDNEGLKKGKDIYLPCAVKTHKNPQISSTTLYQNI